MLRAVDLEIESEKASKRQNAVLVQGTTEPRNNEVVQDGSRP